MKQRYRKPRRWALHTPTTIQVNPVQLAAAGITELVMFTLPAGFNCYTPAQKAEWGQRQIRAEEETHARYYPSG